jgi:hypothetical protein
MGSLPARTLTWSTLPSLCAWTGLTRAVLAGLIVLLALVDGGPATPLRVVAATNSRSFPVVDWLLTEWLHRWPTVASGFLRPNAAVSTIDRAAMRAYLEGGRADVHIRRGAETALERALFHAAVARGLGVAAPLDPSQSIIFPPASLALVEPPRVAIVSPRERIQVDQSELVRPTIDAIEVERLENRLDRLGVSSLVLPIGGLATYPGMVLARQSPLGIAEGAAHEWIHAYLFFSPLGQAYWSSPDARAINETATDIAARELAADIAAALELPRAGGVTDDGGRPNRAARALLRDTRIRVDGLLAAGKVEDAEQLMRDRRVELEQLGMPIRKLNQAYFAFFGSYGDAAAGSSKVPELLRALRQSSPTLGEFLRGVGSITNERELAGLAR